MGAAPSWGGTWSASVPGRNPPYYAPGGGLRGAVAGPDARPLSATRGGPTTPQGTALNMPQGTALNMEEAQT